MPQVVFEGTVFSGKGEGKKFVDLPWVKRQIVAKFGFTPFSGTLNIHLTAESVKKKKLLKNSETQQITPETGYFKGILIKAKICRFEGAIVVPQVSSYPSGVLEVIAAECLREKLQLQDGNTVSVIVNV